MEGARVEEDSDEEVDEVDEVVDVVGSLEDEVVVVDLEVELVVGASLEEEVVVVDSLDVVVVESAAVVDGTGVSEALEAVSAFVALAALLARFTLDDILARDTGNHDKEGSRKLMGGCEE